MPDNELVNALIGAVASFVLGFIPFSPVLGGAVAGYLQKDSGLRVGAISGGILMIPAALLFLFGSAFLPFIGDIAAGAGIFVIGLFVLVGVGLYTVGLSALGGLIGVYLVDEL